MHEETLSKAYGYKYLTKQVRKLKNLVFLLCILLNIVIIISYADYDTDRLNQPSFDNIDVSHVNPNNVSSTKSLLKNVGIINCSLSGFIFLSFIVKTAPILIQRVWRKQENQSQDDQNITRWKRYMKKGKIFLLTCFYTLSNIDVLYHLFYFSVSVLGLTVHPFFYSATLLDILYRFPSLQGVIMTIVIP